MAVEKTYLQLPESAAVLVAVLRQHLPALAARHGVKWLGVFGSYVRNEQMADSDFDVLVEFVQPPTLPDFLALQRHLSDLLGVRVDLVMKTALKPDLRPGILAEAVAV